MHNNPTTETDFSSPVLLNRFDVFQLGEVDMASVLRPEQKLPVREGYSSIAQQRRTRARWAHTNFRPYSLSIDGQLEVLLLSHFPEAKVSKLKQA